MPRFAALSRSVQRAGEPPAQAIVYRQWLSRPSGEQFQSPGSAQLLDVQFAGGCQVPLADDEVWRVGVSRRPGSRRRRRKQPACRKDHQSAGVVQVGVEVQFEPTQRRLPRRQYGLDGLPHTVGKLLP